MSAIGDKIKLWCQEESLSVVAEQDDETSLAYVITLTGEPPLSVSLSGSGPQPGRILLEHTFELPLPAQVAADPEGPQRVATLLERVAATRSGLVRCRQSGQGEKTAAEVVVTLYEDGMTKQGFLTALEEVRKVRRVIAWELEGISATADMLSDLRSIVEEAEEPAPELQEAAAGGEEPAAPAEAPPPAGVPAPAAEPKAAPPPQAPAEPAARFCPSCGQQAKAEHRFCIACGSPLQG